jgi:hydrogenase maturation factor
MEDGVSDMVERVNNAIREAVAKEFSVQLCNGTDYVARAAIEAMREPTEAQLLAAVEWAEESGAALEPIAIGYQRMIDAALSVP